MAITRTQFIEELTNANIWRTLISSNNTEIEVYGALPLWDYNEEATEKTMMYVNQRRDGKFFVPTDGANSSGYWFATPEKSSETRVYKAQLYTNSASVENYNGDGNACICPVVIIPANLVEQRSDGIWRIK